MQTLARLAEPWLLLVNLLGQLFYRSIKYRRGPDIALTEGSG